MYIREVYISKELRKLRRKNYFRNFVYKKLEEEVYEEDYRKMEVKPLYAKGDIVEFRIWNNVMRRKEKVSGVIQLVMMVSDLTMGEEKWESFKSFKYKVKYREERMAGNVKRKRWIYEHNIIKKIL